MSEIQPQRPSNLAEMVEMLLDKGVVINADVVVSIGDTKLLGVKVRAAIASFETAAQYGLEFPEGTDMERVEAAAGGDREGIPAAEDSDVIGATGPAPSIGDEQSEEAESDEEASEGTGEGGGDEGDADGEESTDASEGDDAEEAATAEEASDG